MATRRSSISRRLIISMIIAMPLLLGLTAAAIDRAYLSSLLKAEENRLQAQFFSLLGAVEWNEEDGFRTDDRLKEPDFWQFRSGLYADIQSPDGKQLWRSLSADTLSLPNNFEISRPGEALTGETLIDQKPFLYYRYRALWETEENEDLAIVFSLYSEKTNLIREQRQFRRQMAIWMTIVAFLSVLLISVIQYWGLKPLRRLAKELRLLEKGQAERLGDNYPSELAAITSNLNQLIEKERRQRERYRNTLGDLAHSLKTPLAVLKSGQLDDSQRNEQIERMDNIVRYQLRRAVSSGRQQLHTKTQIKPLVDRLIHTLQKVYHTKSFTAEVALNDQTTAPVDEQDLMELLGNLLDNACKACHARVCVYAKLMVNGAVALFIENDGKGLEQEDIDSMMIRGKRGDQYGDGQGLGLAIVRDIADSCGIELRFAAREQGGSVVTLLFPSPSNS
ncbi:ATP-binding protein [Spongiibacter marinus]|uniref:ATP-binding protein n=1 Tax=Spongiibacter marinus TaxID=354246 RepID=UPI00356B25B1